MKSLSDFPFDVLTDINFLKESINNGNKKSFLYYLDMIIKGSLIPKDHKIAEQLIDDDFNDDSINAFLYKDKKAINKETWKLYINVFTIWKCFQKFD